MVIFDDLQKNTDVLKNVKLISTIWIFHFVYFR